MLLHLRGSSSASSAASSCQTDFYSAHILDLFGGASNSPRMHAHARRAAFRFFSISHQLSSRHHLCSQRHQGHGFPTKGPPLILRARIDIHAAGYQRFDTVRLWLRPSEREILAALCQLRSRSREVSAADLDRLLSQSNIRLITLRMSRSHSVWDTGTPSTGLFASRSRPLLFSLRNTNSPFGHWRTLSLLRITDAAPALACPRSGLGFCRRPCSFRNVGASLPRSGCLGRCAGLSISALRLPCGDVSRTASRCCCGGVRTDSWPLRVYVFATRHAVTRRTTTPRDPILVKFTRTQ